MKRTTKSRLDDIITMIGKKRRPKSDDGILLIEVGEIMRKDASQRAKAEDFLVSYLNDQGHYLSGRMAAYHSLLDNKTNLSQKSRNAMKRFEKKNPNEALSASLVCLLENLLRLQKAIEEDEL